MVVVSDDLVFRVVNRGVFVRPSQASTMGDTGFCTVFNSTSVMEDYYISVVKQLPAGIKKNRPFANNAEA